jgi:uncharacterized protein YbaP (TraB family)
LLIASLLLATAPARADDQGHPVTLWRVAGETNFVYLLGSIHMLRRQDHPLPSVIDRVYDDAEVVVMELDMDDLDPAYTQAAFNQAGVMTEGQSLRELMGEDLFSRAEQAAAAIDIPLELLAQSEPWLAAMTVELMVLYRIGFDPLLGVEMTLSNRARADGKPIEGLETVDEQLGFLDGLPIEAQREMLLQTLLQGATLRESVDELVAAWRHGDTAALEAGLLDSMSEQEALMDALVTDRNRRWAETIAGWLDDDRDYLVVVGALHLVGDEGVPALLEAAGFGIQQLRETAGVR